MERLTVGTPHGPAAAELHRSGGDRRRGALVLGHGAGGSIGAPDLVAAMRGALEAELDVVLVEQPYRVAGRRTPPRAPVLDAAWTAVVDGLRPLLDPAVLVVGGRSSGARVACRTASVLGAAGVVCLAFPLRPPRRPGRPESPDRLDELARPDVPVLVVQGVRDPFGTPPAAPGRTVVDVPGDHGLKVDPGAVQGAVRQWLLGLAATPG